MLPNLVHISDLHIAPERYDEIKYAIIQLKQLLDQHNLDGQSTILVITGDVFNTKKGYCLNDALMLVNLVSTIGLHTIIIPGNHDMHFNDQSKSDEYDLISQALDDIRANEAEVLPLIHYWPRSGTYRLLSIRGTPPQTPDCVSSFPIPASAKNVYWQHIGLNCTDDNIKSMIALQAINPANALANPESTFIALAHTQQPFELKRIKRVATNISGDTPRTSAVLMGDKHIHTIISHGSSRDPTKGPTIAYAGSFVQKNRNDGIYHGAIIWSANKRHPSRYDVKFHPLVLHKAYIMAPVLRDYSIDLISNLVENAKGIIMPIANEKANVLAKFYKVSIIETAKPSVDGMKVCSKCGADKKLDQYYYVNKASGKYRAACKACSRKQSAPCARA